MTAPRTPRPAGRPGRSRRVPRRHRRRRIRRCAERSGGRASRIRPSRHAFSYLRGSRRTGSPAPAPHRDRARARPSHRPGAPPMLVPAAHTKLRARPTPNAVRLRATGRSWAPSPRGRSGTRRAVDLRSRRLRADACRAQPQLWSVARAGSAGSMVAAQLPRSFSASSEREPGSAA